VPHVRLARLCFDLFDLPSLVVPVYANEEFVGTAIRESGVARRDLWITTKYDGGEVLDAVHASLHKVRPGPPSSLV